MTKISELTAAAALDGTEELPVVQSGATVRATAQDIADLGGGGWSKVADVPGTSLTGWVDSGGTWAATTYIEQSDSGASERIAVYAPDGVPYLAGACAVEAEVLIPGSSYSNPDSLIGVGLRRPNASGNGGLMVCVGKSAGSPTLQFFNYGGSGFASIATPPTVGADTWGTLRVVFHGSVADVYFNGTLIAVGGMNPQYESGCITLYAYRAAQFRNIKGWVPSLSLPA